MLEKARDRFGADFVAAVIQTAGCHADLDTGDPIPEGNVNRFVFGLLEAIDFYCPKYDWDCPGRHGHKKALAPVSFDEVKQFLTDNREAVLGLPIGPSSMLGALAGAFDFLFEDERV